MTGYLHPKPMEYLPVFAGIPPAVLHCQEAFVSCLLSYGAQLTALPQDQCSCTRAISAPKIKTPFCISAGLLTGLAHLKIKAGCLGGMFLES